MLYGSLFVLGKRQEQVSTMSSNSVTVIGLQWGDEGKGKVVDALASSCRYVVRYCGGANAGHSVNVGGEKFALHLIPCGILHTSVINVVGNGLAFDPATALEEVRGLQDRGVAVGPQNLRISGSAHVVMPYHKMQDTLHEKLLGEHKIGTTSRGIGPCYADKANRSTAIRMIDLTRPDELAAKIRDILAFKNRLLTQVYGAAPVDAEKLIAEYTDFGRQLAPMICDTGTMLRAAAGRGERILFEGGQGCMLDVDHGTYPFVTSSSVSACGVPAGAGVPPSAVGTVIGVIKSYTSRVGAGPFPTEQDNDIGNRLRQRGREFGTTTGRPRRCGWLDALAVRYAADLSGVDELALSLLMDGPGEIDTYRVAVAYEYQGKVYNEFDPSLPLDKVTCRYEDLPAWKKPIGSARKFSDLPAEAQQYVTRVEELIRRPVGVISSGLAREATIIHHTKVQGLI